MDEYGNHRYEEELTGRKPELREYIAKKNAEAVNKARTQMENTSMEPRGAFNITTSKVPDGYVGQVFVDGVRVWESNPVDEREDAKKLAEQKMSNVFSKMFE